MRPGSHAQQHLSALGRRESASLLRVHFAWMYRIHRWGVIVPFSTSFVGAIAMRDLACLLLVAAIAFPLAGCITTAWALNNCAEASGQWFEAAENAKARFNEITEGQRMCNDACAGSGRCKMDCSIEYRPDRAQVSKDLEETMRLLAAESARLGCGWPPSANRPPSSSINSRPDVSPSLLQASQVPLWREERDNWKGSIPEKTQFVCNFRGRI